MASKISYYLAPAIMNLMICYEMSTESSVGVIYCKFQFLYSFGGGDILQISVYDFFWIVADRTMLKLRAYVLCFVDLITLEFILFLFI